MRRTIRFASKNHLGTPDVIVSKPQYLFCSLGAAGALHAIAQVVLGGLRS
jgi:hypothetical protein